MESRNYTDAPTEAMTPIRDGIRDEAKQASPRPNPTREAHDAIEALHRRNSSLEIELRHCRAMLGDLFSLIAQLRGGEEAARGASLGIHLLAVHNYLNRPQKV